jgi:hypothetical protein
MAGPVRGLGSAASHGLSCANSASTGSALGSWLIAAPLLGSQVARQWIIAVAVAVYGYAAVGNAVATRGRHVRWCLMSGVVALALMGL